MGAQDKSNPAGEHKARHLIRWFNAGAGGKIAWGTPGDFRACVAIAGQHMTPDHAKGFCANRHHDVKKEWPGNQAHGGKVNKAEVPAVYVDEHGGAHRLGPVRFEVHPGPELVIVDGPDRVTVTKGLVTVPASSRGRIHAEQAGPGFVAVEVAGHHAVWTPAGLGVSTPDGAERWVPPDPGTVVVPLPGGGRVRQWFGKSLAPVRTRWDPADHPRGPGGRFVGLARQLEPGDTFHDVLTGEDHKVTATDRPDWGDASSMLIHLDDASTIVREPTDLVLFTPAAPSPGMVVGRGVKPRSTGQLARMLELRRGRLLGLEKARRVRTPEGQQMFDLPIGAVIPPGGKPDLPDVDRRASRAALRRKLSGYDPKDFRPGDRIRATQGAKGTVTKVNQTYLTVRYDGEKQTSRLPYRRVDSSPDVDARDRAAAVAGPEPSRYAVDREQEAYRLSAARSRADRDRDEDEHIALAGFEHIEAMDTFGLRQIAGDDRPGGERDAARAELARRHRATGGAVADPDAYDSWRASNGLTRTVNVGGDAVPADSPAGLAAQMTGFATDDLAFLAREDTPAGRAAAAELARRRDPTGVPDLATQEWADGNRLPAFPRHDPAVGPLAPVIVQPWEIQIGDWMTAHWDDSGPETARPVTFVDFDRGAYDLGHKVPARVSVADTRADSRIDRPMLVHRDAAKVPNPDWEGEFHERYDRFPTDDELAAYVAAQAPPPFGSSRRRPPR